MAHLILLFFLLAGRLVLAGQGLLRLQCQGALGNMRVDPLKAPGRPSEHVHWIEGGSNFGMTANRDALRASPCTSCHAQQDRSAYWAPALYFRHTNGTFEQVRNDGGMLVYYKYYSDSYAAFPPGFRMIAGHSLKRSSNLPDVDPPTSGWSGADLTQEVLAARAIGFNCLHYNREAEATLYRHRMPEKSFLDENCSDGLRLEVQFPSCSNGELDSDDHQSHMAYPSLIMGGTCPDTHPTQMVSLMYETKWRTDYFAGTDGQFVLANGDPTGFGYHGDFMEAWDDGFLQQVIETCQPGGNDYDCPIINLTPEDEMAQCKMEIPDALKTEEVLYPQDQLPNCIQIQAGPADATPAKGCAVSIPTSTPPPSSQASATTMATSTLSSVDQPTTTTANPDAAGLVQAQILAEGAAAQPRIMATSTTVLPDGTPLELLFAETTVVDVVTVTDYVMPVPTPALERRDGHLGRHRNLHHFRLHGSF